MNPRGVFGCIRNRGEKPEETLFASPASNAVELCGPFARRIRDG